MNISNLLDKLSKEVGKFIGSFKGSYCLDISRERYTGLCKEELPTFELWIKVLTKEFLPLCQECLENTITDKFTRNQSSENSMYKEYSIMRRKF